MINVFCNVILPFENYRFYKSSKQSVSNFQGRGLLVPAVTREIVQNLELNKQHFKNFNGERNNKTM